MTTLDKRTAIAAIKVLAGKQFRTSLEHKDATLELLAATNKVSQSIVAEDTITLLLDRFDSDKRGRLFRDHDLLSLALGVGLAYPQINKKVAKRLVRATARAGFHGMFPDLPLKLLKRPSSAEEITLLITAYVEDKGSKGTSTEDKLKGFARSGLPAVQAKEQLKRFDEFDRELERDSLF